jgi:O-antigen/teichoic acid export membrane protein
MWSNMSSKLVRGTFLLTLGSFISKFLGIIYLIPFYQIIGGAGPAALYMFGYTPYTIFISIATAGVPLAISKFISKYNALEEYEVSRQLFKTGLLLMSITGLVSFLLMYSLAPVFASIVLPENNKVYTVADVTTVIRAVSFALLLVPIMSAIRGFFQGHQSMGPTAVSQVVEQIVRIAFLLVGTYVVLRIMDGEMVTAISVATFAAFVGAAASLAVLVVYWVKRKPYLDELLTKSKGQLNPSIPNLLKEMMMSAIPFIVVGIAMSLYQLVDQSTFLHAMRLSDVNDETAKNALGVMNFTTHKLVVLPVTFATAFSLTLVPLITESYVNQEREKLVHNLNQAFQMLLFITVPAVVSLVVLAEPIYAVFYEQSEFGSHILAVYAPVGLLFGGFSVTAAILQGINRQRFTLLSFLVGFITKIVLNVPLIYLFQTEGAIWATAIGYGISVSLNLWAIKHFAHYSFTLVMRRAIFISAMNVIMGIAAFVSLKLISPLFHFSSKFQSLIVVCIAGTIAVLVYVYIGLRSKLMDRLFGQKVTKLRNKLKAFG